MPRRNAISVLLGGLLCLAMNVQAASSEVVEEDHAISSFEAFIKARDYNTAKDKLEPYVKTHPESWQSLYQLGYVYFCLHQFRPSLNMLAKSLAIHDQFSEAHKILGYDLNILGRKDLAISELSKAVQLDPSSWESQYELGRILYEQGSYVESVRAFEAVKRMAPGFVKAYHNLGLAYAGTGEKTKAVENFEEGLRLNSKQPKPSAWPLIDYASYLNMESDFEKAHGLLLQAIGIDPSWSEEYEELSKALRRLGQTQEAIEALKRAIAIDSRKAENHYVLARLYSQTHQDEDAKRELAEYEKTRGKSH
jgi:tetratricopeptide (TPR) repeat protein